MSVRDTPIGTIAAFAGPRARIPDSWEVCDGRSVNSTDPRFHDLFTEIGTSWGGDGAPFFFLPDLKGMFLRGVDRELNAAGVEVAAARLNDPDRDVRGSSNPFAVPPGNFGNSGNNVGSKQGGGFASHSHGLTDPGHSHGVKWGHNIAAGDSVYERSNEGAVAGPPSTLVSLTGITVNPSGGSENRPVNAMVYWMIRARA
jgi:hypothetical protein